MPAQNTPAKSLDRDRSAVVRTLVVAHLQSAWNWRSSHYGRILEAPAYFAFLAAGLASLDVTVEVQGAAVSYVDFVFSGVLVVLAIRHWLWAMSDVANDRKWGVYALSMISGGSFGGYLLSVALVNSLIACGQIAALILIRVMVFGTGDVLQVALTGLATLPVVATSVVAGSLLGMTIKSYNVRDLLNSVLGLPLMLTVPAFYSSDGVPIYLKTLIALNPFTYALHAIRSIQFGTDGLTQGIVFIGFSALLMSFLFLLARNHDWASPEQG
jgi:ABC-2 type transport system permease protein